MTKRNVPYPMSVPVPEHGWGWRGQDQPGNAVDEILRPIKRNNWLIENLREKITDYDNY